jgi:hypothetical protein
LQLVLWQDCCQPATASFSPHFRSVSGEVARNETFCEGCGRWKNMREPIEDFTLIELEFLRQVWVERLLACPFSAVWCVSVLPPADSLSLRALSRVWETLLDLGLLPEAK